mmetsp:Transcript_4079/g.5133  ORF Transcript_4079/g.5133 Transcript_4079/m.5133 type:complete len:105 (-) Transcript_4079:2282-2596(-)
MADFQSEDFYDENNHDEDYERKLDLIDLYTAVGIIYVIFVIAGTFTVCLPNILCGCFYSMASSLWFLVWKIVKFPLGFKTAASATTMEASSMTGVRKQARKKED